MAGIFNSSQLPASFVKKSLAAAVLKLMPNGAAPFFLLMSMMDSETALSTEHGFFTKTMVFPEATTTSAATSTDSIINVASTANILASDLLRVDSTFELLLVTGIIGTTQLQVVRGSGTVAAGAIGSGVKLYKMGSASEEASLRPQAKNLTPIEISNYTQIMRNTWAVTGSNAAVQVVAGRGNVASSREECIEFHAIDIETNCIFGQRLKTVRNGQPYRQMDGAINIISNLAYYPPSYGSANVNTAGGTTTYTQLQNYLEPSFNQCTDMRSGNDRILFVGGGSRRVINDIGRISGNYQIVDGQTSFGLQFETFRTARGTFRMIEHSLLNANPSWSKMALALEMASWKLAYLGNRKSKHVPFNSNESVAVDNGIDAEGGTLTTELTLQGNNPPANAVVFNLTAAA